MKQRQIKSVLVALLTLVMGNSCTKGIDYTQLVSVGKDLKNTSKVNFTLTQDFNDFVGGVWNFNGDKTYNYWRPNDTDTTKLYLYHDRVDFPGVIEVQLKRTSGTNHSETGTWTFIYASGIYEKYTNGSGMYSFTYKPKAPTTWDEYGNPIDTVDRKGIMIGALISK